MKEGWLNILKAMIIKSHTDKCIMSPTELQLERTTKLRSYVLYLMRHKKLKGNTVWHFVQQPNVYCSVSMSYFYNFVPENLDWSPISNKRSLKLKSQQTTDIFFLFFGLKKSTTSHLHLPQCDSPMSFSDWLQARFYWTGQLNNILKNTC